MDVSSNVICQSTSKPFMYIVPPVNAFNFKPPVVGSHPSMAETYYLLFKPLPTGDHTIDVEVIFTETDTLSGTGTRSGTKSMAGRSIQLRWDS